MLGRSSQRHCNIVSDLIPRDRNDAGVTNRSVGKNRDIGGATTNINQTDTQIALVLSNHRVAGGQLLQNDAINRKPTAFDTFLNVLSGIDRAGHQMDLGLQAHARHPKRFTNTRLVVDHIFLRQHMQYFLIRGDSDCLSRVDDPINILLKNLLITNGDNAM